MNVDIDTQIPPIDRDMPSVNARKKTNKTLNVLGIVFVGIVALYLVYTMNAGGDKKTAAQAEKDAKAAKQNGVTGAMPKFFQPDTPPIPSYNAEPQNTATKASGAAVVAQDSAAVVAQDSAAKTNSTVGVRQKAAGEPEKPLPPPTKVASGSKNNKDKSPEELMRDRRRLGTISMPFAATEGASSYPTPNRASTENSEGREVESSLKPSSSGNDLNKLLQPTEMKGTMAAKLFNRSYLIPKGAFIDCALETRIDSTTSGMTSCIVTKNIYSDNGKLVLIDRGSKLTGQYQGGMMKQGSNRIFVLWSRVETPVGVVINLDSPGTDALGGSGLDGHINTHFWQRFGGAIMLSLIQDGFEAAAKESRGGGGQTNVNFGNTQDSTQNMASEALKSTINIPNTLTKNHGDHINVYIARDLDFRTVYGIKLSE